MYAFQRPDQVDIWIRVRLHVFRNKQTGRSLFCYDFRLSEKAGGFLLLIFQEMENRIMKKNFKVDGHMSLLLSGETSQDVNRRNETE